MNGHRGKHFYVHRFMRESNVPKDDWSQKDINRFLDATSEDIINANDKEYLEERIADGVNVKDVAARAKAALKAGVRDYFLEQRKQLEQPDEQRSSSVTGRAPWMKRPVVQLRKLLEKAASQLPPEKALTLCFRERAAGELDQDEVVSALAARSHSLSREQPLSEGHSASMRMQGLPSRKNQREKGPSASPGENSMTYDELVAELKKLGVTFRRMAHHLQFEEEANGWESAAELVEELVERAEAR